MQQTNSPAGASSATPAVYAAMMLGLVFQSFVEAGISAALPEMSRDLGGNGEFVAQMMMGMGALGLMIGALISGRVLELGGTRRTVIGALLVYGIFGAGGLLLHDIRLMAISRVIVGLSASCLVTSCLWAISAEFTGAQRARVYAGAGACAGIGAMASVVIGGYLTQHFGWRYSFAQFTALALLALPIAFAGMRQRFPSAIRQDGSVSFVSMLPLYLLVLVFYAVIGMSSMQLPFLLTANGANDAGARSLIQGLPGLTAIIGASGYGWLQQRLGSHRTFIVSLACLMVGLLTLASASQISTAGFGAVCVGLCIGNSGPYFYHTISERVGVRSAGRFLGYLSAFTFLGAFLNPLAFEPAKTVLGMSGIFFLAAGLVVLIGLGIARIATRHAITPAPAI